MKTFVKLFVEAAEEKRYDKLLPAMSDQERMDCMFEGAALFQRYKEEKAKTNKQAQSTREHTRSTYTLVTDKPIMYSLKPPE